MSQEIGDLLVNQFNAGIQIQHQQMQSRLIDTVMTATQTGEFGFHDQIAPVVDQETNGRHGDTVYTDTVHKRRRVGMRNFAVAELIDEEDMIRVLTDPSNPYSRQFIAAMGRRADDLILEAFGGSAYSGKGGDTPVPFDTNQRVAINYNEDGGTGNQGLTVGKLRRAAELLDDAEADAFGDKYYCAITPKQKYELLRDPEVTSSDFGQSGNVSLGTLGAFMGIDFRVLSSARIPLLAASQRRVFVWAKQAGLYVRSTKGVRGYADRLPQKNQSIQIQVKGDHAATRLWEDAIVDVICAE